MCNDREACLLEEKMQLKAGLSSMLEHKHGLESALQAASEELVELQTQESFRRLTFNIIQRSGNLPKHPIDVDSQLRKLATSLDTRRGRGVQVDEGKAIAGMKDEVISALEKDLQTCKGQLAAQQEAAAAAHAAAQVQTAELKEKAAQLAHLEGGPIPRALTPDHHGPASHDSPPVEPCTRIQSACMSTAAGRWHVDREH